MIDYFRPSQYFSTTITCNRNCFQGAQCSICNSKNNFQKCKNIDIIKSDVRLPSDTDKVPKVLKMDRLVKDFADLHQRKLQLDREIQIQKEQCERLRAAQVAAREQVQRKSLSLQKIEKVRDPIYDTGTEIALCRILLQRRVR